MPVQGQYNKVQCRIATGRIKNYFSSVNNIPVAGQRPERINAMAFIM
jgi:hypothetical protein